MKGRGNQCCQLYEKLPVDVWACNALIRILGGSPYVENVRFRLIFREPQAIGLGWKKRYYFLPFFTFLVHCEFGDGNKIKRIACPWYYVLLLLLNSSDYKRGWSRKLRLVMGKDEPVSKSQDEEHFTCFLIMGKPNLKLKLDKSQINWKIGKWDYRI